MDEELKKRTTLEIIRKKFLLNFRGLPSGSVKIYEKDFPTELEMNFREVGETLKKLREQYRDQIDIQGVFNLSTDLEPFVSKECIPIDLLRSGEAYYKLKIDDKGAFTNSQINDSRPEYIEDRNLGYLSFNKKGAGKAKKIGRHNSIQCQLVKELSSPEFGVLKGQDSVLEQIGNSLGKRVDEYQIDEAMKEINQKLKKVGIRLLLEKKQRQWRLTQEDLVESGGF